MTKNYPLKIKTRLENENYLFCSRQQDTFLKEVQKCITDNDGVGYDGWKLIENTPVCEIKFPYEFKSGDELKLIKHFTNEVIPIATKMATDAGFLVNDMETKMIIYVGEK